MKYFAKKIKIDGLEFDSKAEYERYLDLRMLEADGKIWGLEARKEFLRFEIIPKLLRTEIKQLKTKTKEIIRVEESAAHYTCDFCYFNEQGNMVIEEVKSKATAMVRDYPLRRKLIKKLIHEHNEKDPNQKWEFKEIIVQQTRKKKKK